jgi:hypothetical protein
MVPNTPKNGANTLQTPFFIETLPVSMVLQNLDK